MRIVTRYRSRSYTDDFWHGRLSLSPSFSLRARLYRIYNTRDTVAQNFKIKGIGN